MTTETTTETAVKNGEDNDVQDETRRLPGGTRLRRVDKCGLAFVVLSLFFGTVFAFITPPFWGHDEISHFGRAFQIDHGQVLPMPVPDARGVAYGGQIPQTAKALTDYAFANYHEKTPRPLSRVSGVDARKYEQLRGQSLSAPLANQWFTNTAAYSPVAYVPSVLGLRLAESTGNTVGLAVDLMRIFDLLAYTAVIWFAISALRTSRFKWVVFVAALIPIAVFQAGNITADTLTNGLAILFSALFVKAAFLRQRLSGWQTFLLLASAVLLPLTKPTYLVLTFLLPFAPPARLALGRAGRAVAIGATALGSAGFLAWNSVAAKTGQGMGLMRKPTQWYSVDPSEQVHYVLNHFSRFLQYCWQTFVYQDNKYFQEFFGMMGFSGVGVPALAIVCCMAAGAIAFGMGERMLASRVGLIATIVLFVCSVLAIFGALYLEYSPVGYYMIDGVQGRYFIPLVVIGAAVLLQLVPLRLRLATPRAARGSAMAVVALMTVALSVTTLKFNYNIWG
jgi:uncharacterized membrane protein